MSYIIYAHDNWDQFFAIDFANRLKGTIVKSSEFCLKEFDDAVLSEKLKRCIVVQNKENGKFFIINHHDSYRSCMDLIDILQLDKCMGVLQSQYRKNEEYEKELKIFPFTYRERGSEKFRNAIRDIKRNDLFDKLYFRGNVFASDGRKKRRKVLPLLVDILNDDFDKRVNLDVFCNELCNSKLALCVPGNGNFCHREVECFAVQTPVLMPRLLNSYWNELIPDYHYVSVEINWEKDSPELIAESIKKRYSEVKGQDSFLKDVAKNAFVWYNENVMYPANIDLALKILKIVA